MKMLPVFSKSLLAFLVAMLCVSTASSRLDSPSPRRSQRLAAVGSLQPPINLRGVRRTPSTTDNAIMLRGGSTSSLQKWTVLLVAMALFNDMLQLTMVVPIIHTLVSSPPPLGVSNHETIALGIFFAAKDICQLLFAPLGGILTAKTSPHASLILSTTFLGLATLVFSEATTFRQLLVARGAQGAASAAVLSGGLSLLAETHSQQTRGTAMGQAYSGLAAGLLCGPLVGGLLFDKMGRKRTFRLAAVVVLANAAAQLILFSVAPLPKYKQQITERRRNGTRKKASLVDSIKALLHNGPVLTVAASTFAIHTVVSVIKPLSQVVLDREFGVGMVERSWIITIATLTYFVTTPFAGRWSDHMPKSTLVAASLLCMSLSTVFFALRTTSTRFGLSSLKVCVALLGASLGIHGAAGQALVADLVDQYHLGEYYSMAFALSDMADSLGAISGPVVGLAISQALDSPSAGPGVMGLLCLVLAPFVYRIQG